MPNSARKRFSQANYQTEGSQPKRVGNKLVLRREQRLGQPEQRKSSVKKFNITKKSALRSSERLHSLASGPASSNGSPPRETSSHFRRNGTQEVQRNNLFRESRASHSLEQRVQRPADRYQSTRMPADLKIMTLNTSKGPILE